MSWLTGAASTTEEPPPEFWVVLAKIADLATVLALSLTLLGALSVWIQRARVEIKLSEFSSGDPNARYQARINIWNKGRTAARDLSMGMVLVDAKGKAVAGDGLGGAWISSLDPRENAGIDIDSVETDRGQPRGEDRRVFVGNGREAMVLITWQRPVLRWLNSYALIEAKPGNPIVTRGRAARVKFDKKFWEGSQKPRRARG